MLTRKQLELLHFLHRRLRETAVCPSFEEMKEALNLKSKSGIHRLIGALEERGFVRRLPHRARALEILRVPEAKPGKQELAPDLRPASKGRGEKASVAAVVAAAAQAAVSLPLYGRIAAGLAIEAVSDPGQTIDVPSSMVGRGRYYALEVSGDSMIEAGIMDGDIAIIRHTDTAREGDIVVALVNDGEVTLKRLGPPGRNVVLQPANRNYKVQVYPAGHVRIQGLLSALFRRY
ncbi:MAG: transcriptional repressor LexA [Pseudomonadota bacterium]|nr:transcriptional repressor LexA [Pseudomonadota bacterium]